MKKLLFTLIATFALVSCGKTQTIYVVDSLPEDVATTQDIPDTTRPRPTTTAPKYTPPSNYYTYDEQAYIDSLYSIYSGVIYLSDDELLNMAYTICSTLDTGINLETLLAILASELTYANADTFDFLSAVVASAILNLCPRHQWQIPNY